MKTIKLFSILILSIAVLSCSKQGINFSETVFYDDFSNYPLGKISKSMGAHTEYHYFSDIQMNENWAVTSFYHNPRGADTVWSIVDIKGKKAMHQSMSNKLKFTHPMISTGNEKWRDYRVTVDFIPAEGLAYSGLTFRAQNDRQYYFFGFENNDISLSYTNHENSFHVPEKLILEEKYSFEKVPGKIYRIIIEAKGAKIKGWIDGETDLNGRYHKYSGSISPNEFSRYCCVDIDSRFATGKIALLADGPATFYSIKVETTREELIRIKSEEEKELAEEKKLQNENPKPIVWKKIATPGFGVGRNFRFGDLDNDRKTDILIGQVIQHAAPRDSYAELSCLTAINTDGKILWQIGTPSREHEWLTNDVAFQIYDIDNDGNNEVIYTMNCEIIIADGKTGKSKIKRSTPAYESIQYATDSKTDTIRKWDRILGDCLFFCDLRGKGRPTDLVIKNRYTHFWVLDEKLNTQWSAECRTGHYPYAKDTNGDGKDELYMGYSAFDWTGNKLWSLDTLLQDHGDGVGVVNFQEPGTTDDQIFIAGSDQGAIVLDKNGIYRKIHLIGHVQNPAIANFRSDLPGLETVTVNFWGNQGIIHFFDSKHNIYKSFEPTQYGSMCLPINWNGGDEEFFVLNASVREGGMYDGWGRKAVAFPDDSHPEMCNAVLDFMGDIRDEVVVWNPEEIWIYTQSDSPKQGDIKTFKKNPLYNYSNYQLTVSEPIK